MSRLSRWSTIIIAASLRPRQLSVAGAILTGRYDGQTPRRELLRHCPEGRGIQPPLMHARVTLGDWQMKYLRAMTYEWVNTILADKPVRKWLEKAHELREIYSADVNGESEEEVEDGVPESGKWDNEPEWTGITCVSA